MEEKEIIAYINDIEQDFRDILINQKNNNKWDDVWRTYAIETLKNTRQRLAQLRIGKMQVYDPILETKPFWETIMRSAVRSIWTTNDARETTFGSNMEELLALQKETIERRVDITRVFVFDAEDVLQHARLITVMTNQIFYGINVFAIERYVFNRQAQATGIKLDNPDFMIIDDELLYENHFNSKVMAYRNSLHKGGLLLEDKMQISKLIMKASKKITMKNIGDFPNII